MYACDLRWWDKKRPQSGAPAPSLWVTQDEVAATTYGLRCAPGQPGLGLCREPWLLNRGLNSGYQALNLAYHFGARRILLAGYDMQRTGGKAHWFGDHPPGLQVPSPFKDFIVRFNDIAKDLSLENVEVVNCSIETALGCFPRSTLQNELQEVNHEILSTP